MAKKKSKPVIEFLVCECSCVEGENLPHDGRHFFLHDREEVYDMFVECVRSRLYFSIHWDGKHVLNIREDGELLFRPIVPLDEEK